VRNNGAYSIDLLVAGERIEPVVWSLGTVEFSGLNESKPAYAFLGLLPEITCETRSVEKRAPPAVTMVFNALLLAAPLVMIVLSIRVNASYSLPKGFMAFLWNLVFQLSIIAFLALLTLYWIKLSIYQAFVGLAALTPLTILSGQQYLRSFFHTQSSKIKSE
jgi:hypothetical protein